MTLSDQYSAISRGAALGAVAARSLVAVTGRDRRAYLQGLLTNDVEALTPGSGCYAAWLTPQGRMLTDLHLFESATMLLLDVPAALAQETVARLEQFVFSEDVRIAPLAGTLTVVSLHGPSAAGVVERATEGEGGLESWEAYRHQPRVWGEDPVVVARLDQIGVPGYHLFVNAAREETLRDALRAAGAVDVGQAAIDAARIEAGYPVFGLDMTDDTIPLEAGIEARAISFTKGCYVGQEVVIRVLHRGHGRVARKLVGLRIEGDVPPGGTRLVAGHAPGRDEAGTGQAASAGTGGAARRDVGFVTSAAQSPARGSVALGYVHRDFVEPGTVLGVVAGDRVAAASVTPVPMP